MIGVETAAKIRADAAAIKAEIDAAKAERDAAEAKAKLVREYEQDKPLIKQYLQAFTADGRKLRDRGSGPASLSHLSGKGALRWSRFRGHGVLLFCEGQFEVVW